MLSQIICFMLDNSLSSKFLCHCTSGNLLSCTSALWWHQNSFRCHCRHRHAILR